MFPPRQRRDPKWEFTTITAARQSLWRARSSRFIEAGGLRLHYLDYGSANHPPMLCLHGGMAHAHWFDFVAADFNSSYHVFSLDLRGHGDSAWPLPPDYSFERFAADLDEMVQQLDLRDFVLVGHSMGGMISLTYAATYPGRLARLIIVDSAPVVGEEVVTRLRDFSTQENRLYGTQDELIARYKLVPASAAERGIVRHLAQHGGRQSEGGWVHKFDRRIFAQREVWNGLVHRGRIRIPTLLVKGELSKRITSEMSDAIRSRCPQLKLAEVPGRDHHVMLDNPRGYSQVLSSFLG